MKTLLKSAVLLLGMGLLSTHSQAQKVVVEDKEPNSVMFVTIDKAGNEIIQIMNASQSPRFNEPKAPRFLLTDPERQVCSRYRRICGNWQPNMILAVSPKILISIPH